MAALEKAKQVEELADALSECANTIHERLIDAIDNKEIARDQAQATLQDEGMLRQRANSLYIDAALFVVEGLEVSQLDLLDSVAEAERSIAKIKKIEAFLDLIADLLSLASAVYAAKPKVIIAALKEVKEDVGNIAVRPAPRIAKPK